MTRSGKNIAAVSIFLWIYLGPSKVALADYGILTDSYGIVTEQDLAKAADIAPPGPIIQGEATAFTVWQCYPTVEMTPVCAKHDSYDPQITRRLTLKILHERHLMEFIERRPCDEKNCREALAEWKALLRGEKVACISASYDAERPPRGADKVTRRSIWTIDRIKSHRGSWSYFINQ